jgi:hypothetical protein
MIRNIKTWVDANRDKVRKNNRAHYARNKKSIARKTDAYRRKNISKARENYRRYYAANRHKIRDWRYGTGANEHYVTQIKIQKHKCAICRKPFKVTPDFDHDHLRNQWRGVLCHSCNKALGLFTDNVRTVQRAVEYLRFWRKHVRRLSSKR